MFALVTGVQPCALPIYHFGDPDSGLSLQPLRDLDTPADAEWAHGWLMTVLQLQGLRLDPHHPRELSGAVDALAPQPVRSEERRAGKEGVSTVRSGEQR